MSNRMSQNQPFTLSPKHLARRHRKELCFRLLGLGMVLLACSILVALLGLLAWNALPGLQRTVLQYEVEQVKKDEAPREQVIYSLRELLNAPEDMATRREMLGLVSLAAGHQLKTQIAQMDADEDELNVRLMMSDAAHRWASASPQKRADAQDEFRLSARQIDWLTQLEQQGAIRTEFNWGFFTGGDSREPELASFGGAIIGSLWLLLVCLGVSFPLAVCTAVYLEEFKPTGKLVDLIEVNINNLAAVPSIVFGLLGLAIFLNLWDMPRSAPIVGGLTLALMILPTIIIATRAALKAVPPSIRDAARGLGASDLQVVMHHTLPLALPGIMTGTILGLARAIGETAPLLMIGMVAFIVDVPHSVNAPATVMPVQIYLWANNPEVSFLEKTSAGILVLLGVLIIFNAVAIGLRKRFEVRW
jgi:phosphate transport system permease protein